MRDRDLDSSDGLWTAFEAEAMPHVDRLFRLAMWWERDRREAKTRLLTVEDPDNWIAETVPFVPPVPQHLTDEDVLAALRGIHEAFQDIILLSDVEELTYKEIATVLKIP